MKFTPSVNAEQKQRLTEIIARMNAATPGPWWCDSTNSLYCHDEQYIDDDKYIGDVRYDEDGPFLAHARDDVPWLLELVRRLEGDCDAMAEEWA